MKPRSKKLKVKKIRRVSGVRRIAVKKIRRVSSVRRLTRLTEEPKELSLLEKIAKVTDELQMLRSRLANAGEDLPAVGTHRIASLEHELERLWEMRRHEQAAPLRKTALSEEEEKALGYSVGNRGN